MSGNNPGPVKFIHQEDWHVMGIDPGFDGAIAFYKPGNLVVFDMPCVEVSFMKKATKGPYKGKMRPSTRREIDLYELRRVVYSRGELSEHVFLEWVTAGKQQGATSMFRFGEGFGELKGILACSDHFNFTKVKPQMWKKYFGLSKDKKESLELARKLFPGHLDLFKRVKDNGRAEAALIAKYGWDQRRTAGLPIGTLPGDIENGKALATLGSS